MSESESTTTPAPQTTTKPEPKFLRQARGYYAARPLHSETPPDRLEAQIQAHARELAIFHSPVGRAASRIYDLAEKLLKALNAFEREFEDDMGIEWMLRDAIADAKVKEGDLKYEEYNRDHFNGIIEDVRGWAFLLRLLVDHVGRYSTTLKIEPDDQKTVAKPQVSA